MNLGKNGLLLMGGFQCFLVGCYSNSVAICAAWWRPESSEMDVFTLQLITMSDAASLDV